MLEKEQIKINFSRSAPHYEQHAVLQKELADELLLSLAALKPQKILDLGCGTGYLTCNLAEKFSQAEVVGLDIAPGMIEVADKKRRRKNLTFKAGDAENIVFGGESFDLVVSNASLQWMSAKKVLGTVFKGMISGGRFVFNTFGPQTLKELKESGFCVNEFISVNQLIEAADRQYKIVEIRSKIVPQRFKNVKELVGHLKEIGAQNPGSSRKTDAFSAMRRYKENNSSGKDIVASYEVISGYLLKP